MGCSLYLPWIDAVPHYDVAKSNYGIDSDPLSEAVYNGSAVRIGSEIPELDYARMMQGLYHYARRRKHS
jgi:hypothetical protein